MNQVPGFEFVFPATPRLRRAGRVSDSNVPSRPFGRCFAVNFRPVVRPPPPITNNHYPITGASALRSVRSSRREEAVRSAFSFSAFSFQPFSFSALRLPVTTPARRSSASEGGSVSEWIRAVRPSPSPPSSAPSLPQSLIPHSLRPHYPFPFTFTHSAIPVLRWSGRKYCLANSRKPDCATPHNAAKPHDLLLNIRWRDGLSPEAANACCHSWKKIGFFWASGVIRQLSFNWSDMQLEKLNSVHFPCP